MSFRVSTLWPRRPRGNPLCCRLSFSYLLRILSFFMKLFFYIKFCLFWQTDVHSHTTLKAPILSWNCSFTLNFVCFGKQRSTAIPYWKHQFSSDHCEVKWSLKLSSVTQGNYLDGWPPGNPLCCRLLLSYLLRILNFFMKLFFYIYNV